MSDRGPFQASSSVLSLRWGFFFPRQDGHFSIKCGLTDDQLLAKAYKKVVFRMCCLEDPLKYSTKTLAPSLLIRPPLQNSLLEVPRPSFLSTITSVVCQRSPHLVSSAVSCHFLTVGPVFLERCSLSLRKFEYLWGHRSFKRPSKCAFPTLTAILYRSFHRLHPPEN